MKPITSRPRLKIRINHSRSVRNVDPSPLLKSSTGSKSSILESIYTKVRNRIQSRSRSPEQPKSPSFPKLAPSFSQGAVQWAKTTLDSDNSSIFDEERDRSNSDETYRINVNPLFLPRTAKLEREPSSPLMRRIREKISKSITPEPRIKQKLRYRNIEKT